MSGTKAMKNQNLVSNKFEKSGRKGHKKMKNKKSAGMDGIQQDILVMGGPSICQSLNHNQKENALNIHTHG